MSSRTVARAMHDVANRNDPMTKAGLATTYGLYSSNHPQDFPPASEEARRAAHAELVAEGTLRDTGLEAAGAPIYRVATGQEQNPVRHAPRPKAEGPPQLFDVPPARPGMMDP